MDQQDKRQYAIKEAALMAKNCMGSPIDLFQARRENTHTNDAVVSTGN
jgi:hypothetical protein